jgi:hypothetical protein
MTRDTAETVATIHPFERAGLGAAPFRVVGVKRQVGPITLAGGVTVGAPGQPMGCCAYCSQGIAECWTIESADGRRFTVGCDCVARTYGPKHPVVTAGLRIARRLRADAKHAKDQARIDGARALLTRPEVAARLAAQPHSRAAGNDWFADKTRLDEIDWLLKFAGCRGRLGAARVIEQAAEEVAR